MIKLSRGSKNKQVIDHTGREFINEVEMCRCWGIDYNRFVGRIRRGWDIEKALTLPLQKSCGKPKSCKDHLGNEYKSANERSKKYNINSGTVKYRLQNKWDLEDALTKEKTYGGGRACKDHLGNEYRSIKEMCLFWNIDRGIVYQRLRAGWSLERALTEQNLRVTGNSGRRRKCRDHLGNEYMSLKEMCNKYGIAESKFLNRLSHGWDLQKALTYKAGKGK